MEITLFRWDANTVEHIASHGVTTDEVEELAFDDRPYVRKSGHGRRYLYGQTLAGRYLFVVYVVAAQGIARAITARDMDDREKQLYSRRGK